MRRAHKSVVVISRARDLNYANNFTALPPEYGTPAYEQRADVRAIRDVVWENLAQLDAEIHFGERIRNRKVLIKPNLVTVFHDLGMQRRDFPETTDPRVIDVVVLYLQQFTREIHIVESSGRGMPTWASFRISGLDRLARVRKVGLLALEEQPADRYLLPRARIMREAVIPRVFSQVVRGEAFYISMPKMKTNLYTGVTLGFKNAMGLLTYNLRQRNHNYSLDQKLVDLLHLIQADLTIIDGIVGGEGNCPAPVEPVHSRVIVSGNHCVETDRAAARLMGFDPGEITLLRAADENGFGDPDVRILGEQKVIPFRRADPSLLGEWMQQHYPNVNVLVGHSINHAPAPDERGHLTSEQLCLMEAVCRGGCLATTRYAFDMLYYEGKRRDFPLTVIIGAGANHNGQPVYYDARGNIYTPAQIAALPGKKMAVGACARGLKASVNAHVDGCMPFPNSPHMVLHQLSGTSCSVISPRNKFLLPALFATLRMCERRKVLLRSGQRLDVPPPSENLRYEPRAFTEEEQQMDWIYEPFEPLTPREIRQLCWAENRSVLATFWP